MQREVRRRTHVVGVFSDWNSALMLVAARLRHIAGTKWGTRGYLDMKKLARLLNKYLGVMAIIVRTWSGTIPQFTDNSI